MGLIATFGGTLALALRVDMIVSVFVSLLSELCTTMSEGEYATFVSVAMLPLFLGGWGTELGDRVTRVAAYAKFDAVAMSLLLPSCR